MTPTPPRARAGDARSGPTLHDLFVARARAHPDAEALRVLPQRARTSTGAPLSAGDKPLAITWRVLEARARAIANGLQTLGANGSLPPSARVAILCDTRLEWVLVDVACVMAGLVSVPLFPNIEPETLRRVLVASDSQVVVAENPWQAKKLLDIRAQLASEPRLVLIDEMMTLASGASASLAELGPMGAPPLTLAAIELRGEEARGRSDVGRTEAMGSPSGLLPEALGSPSGLLPEAPMRTCRRCRACR